MNIISEVMERVRKRYLLYAHYIISTYNTAKSADKMLMGLNYADKYVVHEETQKTLKLSLKSLCTSTHGISVNVIDP